MSSLPLWAPSFGSRAGHGDYEHLAEQGDYYFDKEVQYEPPTRVRRVFTKSRVIACAALFASLWAIGLFVTPSDGYRDWAPASGQPSFMHLVVPASHEDTNLCKTLYSSAILGYPSPALINWNKTFHNPNMFLDASHIAKIAGVLEYLRSLPESSNDDLVLVVDGYDVWFQLRPSVLIQRYLDMNARANRRTFAQIGRAMSRENVQQTVVFSSQKKCWPNDDAYNARCYSLPESTLAPDVYGPNTDVEENDEATRYRRMRQRYLNSGAVIGPRKQLLAVYERAHAKADSNTNLFSDQGIFADMLGEQEFQREVLRLRHRTWSTWLSDMLRRIRGTYHSITEDAATDMAPAAGTPYEFGIGVDYASELVQATVFAEYDTAWLARSDTAGIAAASASLNITSPQVGPLSADVEASTPPFAAGAPGTPSAETRWSDVPLFTNLYTGISPVAVHHNAWRDGLKNRRETHWNQTWFQPYARALLTAHTLAPPQALAELDIGDAAELHGASHFREIGEQMMHGLASQARAARGDSAFVQDWFGAGQNQGGAEIFGGGELGWMEMCKGTAEEIFRDGEGEWEDPRLVDEADADGFD